MDYKLYDRETMTDFVTLSSEELVQWLDNELVPDLPANSAYLGNLNKLTEWLSQGNEITEKQQLMLDEHDVVVIPITYVDRNELDKEMWMVFPQALILVGIVFFFAHIFFELWVS